MCRFILAFPERQGALLVTMMLEIPVLLMITGGSDALCQLLGRSRYHLLLGFLPLTSAISGNVGLQASTLTTRAISHSHVTADSYRPWFLREVGVSACLGLGMGSVLGTIAYFASGRDLAFGVTILIAQFVSIVTAGITGTFAPLLFSFIFKRDSGKWSGPLETAIQDIVGSFAMIVLSYHVLVLLSSGDVDPSDRCYVVDTKS
jgi:Mg/Co/Ni transporter MgtE